MRSRKVFDVSPLDVGQVSFLRGEKRLVITRDENGTWKIRQPVQWTADRHTVEGMLAYLNTWQVSMFVKPANTNVASHAISNPWGIIELSRKRMDADVVGDDPRAPRQAFEVLNRATIGIDTNTSETVYVESLGIAGFSTLDPRMLKAMPADSTDPLSYRDREVVAVLSDDVRRISLAQAGTVQTIVRAENNLWRPEQGSNLVDKAAVDEILFQVAHLRALRIEAMSPDALTPYGLDDSASQLTLGLRGEQGIQKSLLFGFRSGTDGVFSTLRGLDVIFALSHEVVQTLTHSLLQPLRPVASSVEISD